MLCRLGIGNFANEFEVGHIISSQACEKSPLCLFSDDNQCVRDGSRLPPRVSSGEGLRNRAAARFRHAVCLLIANMRDESAVFRIRENWQSVKYYCETEVAHGA